MKISIEVMKETYTWIICHRTTVINHTEHLKVRKGKEIRLKTSSAHLTKTELNKIYGTGSWFDQNEIESSLAGSALTRCSMSEKKFATGKMVSTSDLGKINSTSNSAVYLNYSLKTHPYFQWLKMSSKLRKN